MYKVFISHNRYRSAFPSGENVVVETEHSMLESRGHETEIFLKHSDSIESRGVFGKTSAVLGVPWNFISAQAIRKAVTTFQPDIVHVHNTFPLLSPAIFPTLGKRVARVLTLHNYRLFCAAGIPMRSGRICTECLDQCSATPSLVHGCYRGNRLATLPLALSIWLHRFRGTWINDVDAFICLTEFQRRLMVDTGLPAKKVHVKPNFYPGNPTITPWKKRVGYMVFAGRLGAEKGLLSLMQAWQLWGKDAPELRIVGDGELRNTLETMASDFPVRFLGQLSAVDAQAEIANASMLILPSECLEGFPMVIREAFAFGTPAAVSNIGPLPSIVKHGKSGIVFEPASPESLLQAVRTAWTTHGLLATLGQGARAEFENKYTEETNYQMLMEIYRRAIDVSRNEK